MNSRLRSSILLASLAIAASGCGLTASGEEEEIRIGVSVELSGASAALGTPEANALELVEKQINKERVLGKKIKLIVKDNRSDPQASVQYVSSMIDDDKVVGILGGSTEATTLPIIDVVEQERVPTISMAASLAVVLPVDERKFVFKTAPSGLAVIEVLRKEFASKGTKRVCLLAPDNNYGKSAVEYFSALAKKDGVVVAGVEWYEESDKDYSAQVSRLVAANPQSILVGGIMPSVGIAAKNIKDSGFKGRTYFDGGAEGELFAPGETEGSEGMLMVGSSVVAADRISANTPTLLAQKEFFSQYTRSYFNFSNYAAYAADALHLMVAAIRKANSTDREKVRDALENLSHDGLTGTFSFNPQNHGGANDGLAVLVVRSGVWTLDQ